MNKGIQIQISTLNVWVCLRGMVAGIFAVSGLMKLINPIDSFIVAILSYDLLPQFEMVEMIAEMFPWIEFLTGVFLIFGLWTNICLIISAMVSFGYIVFAGQAITRGLVLTNNGFLGGMVQLSLTTVLVINWMILGVLFLLYLNIRQLNQLSLDKGFEKKPS
jgi:uncharacterized membrane protein YphA (DoxX/SURF4 family)